MTELQRTFMQRQQDTAADLFGKKPYSQHAMPRRLLAGLATYLLPLVSVAAGMVWLAGRISHMLPTWAAMCMAAGLLALLEVAKAQSVRSHIRSVLQGGHVVTLELCLSLACIAATAACAVQGAKDAYVHLTGNVQAVSMQEEAQRIEAGRTAALAPLQEQAKAIGAQRWKSETDKRSLLSLAQQQQAVNERYDAQLARITQAHQEAQVGTLTDAKEIGLAVALIELAILAANMYVMYYYYRVWEEAGRKSQVREEMMRMAGDMEDAEEDAQGDPDVVASLLARCTPAAPKVSPPAAAEAPRRPIGFSVHTDKERMFMDLWQQGERNPKVFCRELRLNLSQYKQTKIRLRLA